MTKAFSEMNPEEIEAWNVENGLTKKTMTIGILNVA